MGRGSQEIVSTNTFCSYFNRDITLGSPSERAMSSYSVEEYDHSNHCTLATLVSRFPTVYLSQLPMQARKPMKKSNGVCTMTLQNPVLSKNCSASYDLMIKANRFDRSSESNSDRRRKIRSGILLIDVSAHILGSMYDSSVISKIGPYLVTEKYSIVPVY